MSGNVLLVLLWLALVLFIRTSLLSGFPILATGGVDSADVALQFLHVSIYFEILSLFMIYELLTTCFYEMRKTNFLKIVSQ